MWDDKTWEKYGALGGIWFIIFALVGGLLGGTPPSRTDPAAEIAEWYRDNDTAIQVGMLLIAIGAVGLVWWLGSLYRAMRRAADSERLALIAVIGFVVSGSLAFASFGTAAGTASAAEHLGEGAVVFNEINNSLISLSSVGDVILIVAVSALARRSGFLPKWLAQVGVLIALISAVAVGGVASTSDFFAVWQFVAFITWALWIIAVGVRLFQTAPDSAEAAAAG